MIVNFKARWGAFEKTMELKDALCPDGSYDGGSVEQAQYQGELNAKVIGALAALLVERGIIPLEAAAEACDIRGEIEVVSKG